ncbi:MAG TPA: cellulase-like family protein, partial [Deinococcales bacterium]|nr:cellulase-like family protein [Deinococcales bacterium]
DSIDGLKARWPDLNYTFSFCSEYDTWPEQDVSMLDFLEPHVWMAQSSDFYQRVGYHYERFDPIGYTNLALKGEAEYLGDRARYDASLVAAIHNMEAWSRASGKALITTECWGVVDYKDFPLLNWGYVKDLCALGVREAAATGRWAAIATSNFCGPQFRGMWRDVAWHRELTDLIHASALPPEARG